MSVFLQLLQRLYQQIWALRNLSAKTTNVHNLLSAFFYPSLLITFGSAGLLDESAFPGKTRPGLMRSNSQPVHKPRLPAGRPEHAGISTTLKTKWSFPGCLRRELQRWHHRWFEMEKGRDRGETSACESVCARHTDSDKQGGSENRVKHRAAQGEQKIGKDYFRPITSAWPLLTATHFEQCQLFSDISGTTSGKMTQFGGSLTELSPTVSSSVFLDPTLEIDIILCISLLINTYVYIFS